MLASFPCAVAAGVVFGFLSGLGVGGGSLLLVWLTMMAGLPAEQARSINLLFFLPAALCACFFRWKQGSLPLKKLWLPIGLGCIFAAGASFLSGSLDADILQKLFGLLLLVTGLRELFYREESKA